MASLRGGLSLFSGIASNINLKLCSVRNKYYNRWMRRDIKRRLLAKQYAEERLRLVAMKRNDILPPEIIEAVAKQIDETIPRQTALRQLTFRCVISSRSHGVVKRWKITRHMFRHLADYNFMSGVQRAMW